MLFAVVVPAVCMSAEADATMLLQNGRADEALLALNSQIRKNPNDARAYHVMARTYFQLEHWEEAIRAAEKAVELAPQESEYHQWLGRAYGKKAEAAGPLAALSLVRKVKVEFEKAVMLDPAGKNLSARVDLAEFYTEAPYVLGGDKTKARHLAAFITNLDSALGDCVLGRVEEKQNARSRAEQQYQAAIQASGSLARYWVELAGFYRRAGRLTEMEAAINQSLATPRKEGISLFDAASVLMAAGRNFPGAIDMLRRYLTLEYPGEDGPAFQAHYWLGLLLEKQGEEKAAASEYRAALALASQYRPAQEALARLSR
jgi:tetratricopeptide (TPR) repeat protein